MKTFDAFFDDLYEMTGIKEQADADADAYDLGVKLCKQGFHLPDNASQAMQAGYGHQYEKEQQDSHRSAP